MSNLTVSEVLWSSGMGITSGDLNDAQRFVRTLVGDGIMGAKGQRQLTSTSFGADPGEVRAAEPGAGAPYAPGVVLQISNLSGVIWFWVAGAAQRVSPNVAGGAPGWLPYFLEADELLTTLAVGNAANPRIDRISIKATLSGGDSQSRDFEAFSLGPVVGGVQTYLRTLSTVAANRKRLVTIQKQVTQGTPAASPVPPATPAGYVPLWDVLVPQNYNANFTPLSHFRDWRMPMHPQVAHVLGPQALVASGWGTLGNGGWDRISGAAAEILVIPCAASGAGRSRLVGMSIRSTGAPTWRLQSVDLNIVPPSLTNLDTLTNGESYEADFTGPIWDTGLPISIDSLPVASRSRYQLALKITSGAVSDTFRAARFYLMGPG